MALPKDERNKLSARNKHAARELEHNKVSRYQKFCVVLLLVASILFMTMLADVLPELGKSGLISTRTSPFISHLIAGDGLTPTTGIDAIDGPISDLMNDRNLHQTVTNVVRGILFFLLAGLIPGLARFWTLMRDSTYSNAYINTWGVIILVPMAGYFGYALLGAGMDFMDVFQTPDFYGSRIYGADVPQNMDTGF